MRFALFFSLIAILCFFPVYALTAKVKNINVTPSLTALQIIAKDDGSKQVDVGEDTKGDRIAADKKRKNRNVGHDDKDSNLEVYKFAWRAKFKNNVEEKRFSSTF